MGKKINYVMAGRGKDTSISRVKYRSGEEKLDILGGKDLSSSYVSSYTVIDEIEEDKYAYLRDMKAILPGVYEALGGIHKEYLIAVEWKDGDKSLISLDEEYYKIFIKNMF
ncbi:MAG: hypothetical protein J5979_04145, partial [Lachnospiraceae bacterium]|nr:hypothetical protein [Lachnospiraceae bacterium]